MDFFASQDRARASTRRLVFFYILALVGVVVSLNAVAVIVYGVSSSAAEARTTRDPRTATVERRSVPSDESFLASNLGVITTTTVSVLTLVALATMFKKLQIGGDGAKVAELLGGREITNTPDDLDERKYVNVVEEMSLASGVAKPRIYVMDHEEGINAFAAGTRPEAAVVSVTRGTLQKLSRDELQGVVAHEFSHILNGDMRINLRMIALNFGLMAIGYIGLQIIRFAPSGRSSNRKNGDNGALAMFAIGAAMMVVGYVGTLFGKMLQAAISRQREFLADASAVQFTRNPGGIAGALKKIGGFSEGSKLATPHAGEAAHMFFGEGVAGFLGSVFATHPPLEDRIRAIEPNFNGVIPELADTSVPAAQLGAVGFAGTSLPRQGQVIAAQPDDLRASRDVIEPREISFAAQTLDAIPDSLLAVARDPYAARALGLSLLLDSDSSLREGQLATIGALDDRMAQLAATLWTEVESIGPAARLPLLELALPALRQMTPTQRSQFLKLCQACAEADVQLSPFELAVSRVLADGLRAGPQVERRAARYQSVTAVRDAAAVILSALATAGGDDQADRAYAIGAARLELAHTPQRLVTYDAAALSNALEVLRDATPAVQRRLVDAAAHCVASDRVVHIDEIELMRALCAAFAVPIPPFFQTA